MLYSMFSMWKCCLSGVYINGWVLFDLYSQILNVNADSHLFRGPMCHIFNIKSSSGAVALNIESIVEMIDSLCLTPVIFLEPLLSLKSYISHNPLCVLPPLSYVTSWRMSMRTGLSVFVLGVKQTRRFPFKSMASAQSLKCSVEAGGAANHLSSGLAVD